jgi:hypothetical protein
MVHTYSNNTRTFWGAWSMSPQATTTFSAAFYEATWAFTTHLCSPRSRNCALQQLHRHCLPIASVESEATATMRGLFLQLIADDLDQCHCLYAASHLFLPFLNECHRLISFAFAATTLVFGSGAVLWSLRHGSRIFGRHTNFLECSVHVVPSNI